MGYSYTLELNQFGDLKQDEYLSDNFRGFRPDLSKNMSEESLFVPPGGVHLPFKVDWRTRGFVSPVKDQGGHSSASSLSSVPLAHSCESRMPSCKAEALWHAGNFFFFFTECNVFMTRGHQWKCAQAKDKTPKPMRWRIWAWLTLAKLLGNDTRSFCES